ncbi:serine/threonine-protein kinase [Sulfurimonas sp.]|uniref:serine/threonine-protein kinase n=1 Tax=Sulfurimonas sp. TaxID=2022749 RepID=UPI003D0F10E3
MCVLKDIYNNATGTFNQRYIIHQYLAVGGMSVVFKVKDIYREYFSDHKELVIKIPAQKLLDKEDIAAFMYSEYTFLRDIEHKNIVKVYDYGIDNETKIPFIIMEFLKGRLLEDIPIYQIQQDEKLLLFHSLYDTVNHIHEKGIIHADITPKNIVVSKEQKATIFDFGISQTVDDVKDFGLDYRQIKAYNPKYTAPEILQGGIPSISSDLFSFALVFYEVFSGELPFYKDSLELIDKPLTLSNCSNKIPLLLQNWFINVLVIDAQKRKRELPFLYNFFKKVKNI